MPQDASGIPMSTGTNNIKHLWEWSTGKHLRVKDLLMRGGKWAL